MKESSNNSSNKLSNEQVGLNIWLQRRLLGLKDMRQITSDRRKNVKDISWNTSTSESLTHGAWDVPIRTVAQQQINKTEKS